MIKFGRSKGPSRNLPLVVLEIVSPCGPPVEERPKVLSELERLQLKDEKLERRRRRKLEKGKGEGKVLTKS